MQFKSKILLQNLDASDFADASLRGGEGGTESIGFGVIR